MCRKPRFDTDTDTGWVAAHRKCWEDFYAARHPERRALKDLMDPWDPELEAHMRKEYQQGRLRPSTERVD